jgi:hypothetical protein
MRKLILGTAALLALASAGLALAKGGGHSVAAVTGTFTATTVSQSSLATCTTSDGKQLQTVRATYAGTAAGDATFMGAVSIQTSSTIDTTDQVGVVRGRIRFGAGGSEAKFTAVYDHGNLAGLAAGHTGSAHATLVANLSAAYTPTGGFSGGKIGGSAGGAAVELAAGGCAPPGTKHGDSSTGKHKKK